MTDVDAFLPVAAQPSTGALVDQAVRAEALGYDTVWLPESWGRNAMVVLTSIAERTDTVDIGTSIANIYSRSPALIGMSAATLNEVSDGRFRVGLGPSGPVVIENWHGTAFDEPLRRLREATEIVRVVQTGEVVDYDGSVFDLSGFRLRFDPPAEPAPVEVAAMGPKAVELAGRFADGWHAVVFTREGMRDRLADLERGAELGDRSVDDVRVALSVTSCALEDRERARELCRGHTAFYLGGMGTFYRDSLAQQGYEDVAHTVHDAWNDGDRETAMAAIDDELLDELTIAGTPEECRERLAAFRSIEGVDAVNVSFPRGATTDEIDRTLATLAPE